MLRARQQTALAAALADRPMRGRARCDAHMDTTTTRATPEPPSSGPRSPAASTASGKCAVCGRPFESEYFVCGGRSACAACARSLRLSGPPITRAQVLGALGLGVFTVIALLPLAFFVPVGSGPRPEPQLYVLNFFAGILVGAAVRIGARLRGGIVFQGIALVLVYPALMSTYVPFVLTDLVGPGHVHVLEEPYMLFVGFVFSASFPLFLVFAGPGGYLAVGGAFVAAWLLNLRLPAKVDGPFRFEDPAARG